MLATFRRLFLNFGLRICRITKAKSMKNLIYMLAAACVASSCASSYNIEGTSNISTLDGQKVYLKVIQGDEFKDIDSCDVLHGQFSMHGTVDTARMALLVNDNMRMPLVLEEGNVTIKIDNAERVVGGTAMNDSLFNFVKTFSQLENEESDLVHTHDQAIMNGDDMEQVVEELNRRYLVITEKKDKLVTKFITDNFDNVLGPGVFLMVTMNDVYPELSPWIEDIMSKATDHFKNDAYVKMYYERAQENQAIRNGTKDIATPAPQNPDRPIDAAPTPADMARQK